MKLNMIKLVMIVLTVYFNMNCFIGSHRDACRYNLHESEKSNNCNYLGFSQYANSKNVDTNTEAERAETINFLILECIEYYEKLKECDKEEYKYMPAIYGINTNPVSPSEAEVLSKRL
ncbi:hypothetical protein [Leptospira alstonii]|uniref:hypothetical protein n=1 Tax=Leptospira alstonii TaxID=28452 RepID=UPI000AD980D4|nr:hypothetical protein [Leptospira alstonii]